MTNTTKNESLLHTAVRQVLGPHVAQCSSNITTERLRFDFSHNAKLNEAELHRIETLVYTQIERDLLVTWVEMPMAEAKQSGAIGIFEERYGEQVKVYTIGDFS